jgi:hypothetical protein
MFKVCGAAAEPFDHTKAVVLQFEVFPPEIGPSPNLSGHIAGDVMFDLSSSHAKNKRK